MFDTTALKRVQALVYMAYKPLIFLLLVLQQVEIEWLIVSRELMYLAIAKFAIALWLVQSKLATLSTNQMQNYIAHELVIHVFLRFR